MIAATAEPIFQRIARSTSPALDIASRRASLLAFIKTETRWRMLARPATPREAISETAYRTFRHDFVRVMADVRAQRMPDDCFYETVAAIASDFMMMIEARRARR